MSLVLAQVLLACGGVQQVPQTPLIDETVTTVDELNMIQVNQNTRGFEARLVFATGYRDVSPPALLTLLAWSLDSPTVTARAELETFSLSTECTTPNACVEALSQVLARQLSAQDHASLLNELRHTARHMRADPAQRTLTLATSGALGKEVSPWAFSNDADALSREALAELVEARFVRQDALVLFSGPFQGTESEVDLSSLLTRLGTGQAESIRDDDLHEPQELTLPSGPVIAFVEGGGQPDLSVAVRLPRNRDLGALSTELLRELGDTARVFVLQLSDAQLLLVHLGAAPTEARSLAYRVIEGAQQAPTSSQMVSSEPALRWLQGRSETSNSIDSGLGAICRDGANFNECADVFSSTSSGALSFEGQVNELQARGHLGGTFVAVERRASNPVLALFFEGGSAEEPPREHGRHALVASALAARCGGQPVATPSRFGVILDLRISTASSPQAVASEALLCLGSPPTRAEWMDAKARLLELVRTSPERDWIVDAVAPSSPGWLMPYASETGIAGAHLGPWVHAAMSRERARVAVVGDIDVEALVEFMSESSGFALPELHSGIAAPIVTAPPIAEPHLAAAEFDSEQARVALVFHASADSDSADSDSADNDSADNDSADNDSADNDSADNDSADNDSADNDSASTLAHLDPGASDYQQALSSRQAGAEAFARAVTQLFSANGVSVRWSETTSSAQDATVLLSLSVPADLIEALPPLFVEIADLTLASAPPREVPRQEQSAQEIARRLAETMSADPASASPEIFDALGACEATVVIGRRQSEAAMARYQ